MPGCENQDIKVKELKKDQNWMVRGAYDYARYQGNLEKGLQAEVRVFDTLVALEGVANWTNRLWL
jgi:hypothetical protein